MVITMYGIGWLIYAYIFPQSRSGAWLIQVSVAALSRAVSHFAESHFAKSPSGLGSCIGLVAISYLGLGLVSTLSMCL